MATGRLPLHWKNRLEGWKNRLDWIGSDFIQNFKIGFTDYEELLAAASNNLNTNKLTVEICDCKR